MWERLTQLAMRAIYFAQEEAAALGENYVGTETLLLGLIREEDNVAGRALVQSNVSPGDLAADTRQMLVRGHGFSGQEMQLTTNAAKAARLAAKEAEQLQHTVIGTGHLLLGLIQVSNGIASKVMVKRGLALEPLRREVAALQDEENQRSVSEL